MKVAFFEMGKTPNQAYASTWNAINLHTGKAVVEENFRNLHWDLISHDDTLHTEPENESNAKSNTDVQVYDYSESTKSSDAENEPSVYNVQCTIQCTMKFKDVLFQN